jgi:repressor LexA
MGNNITDRQKELLQFIVKQIREHNLPPSISEMANFLKVKSKNAVAKLLDALEEQGFIKTNGKARGIQVLNSLGESLEQGLVRLPILGNIQAGSPHLAEEQIEDWINLPQTLIKSRRDVFLLRVRGNSMINAGIYEGDLVIVRPTRDVKNNDIVVALLHDEATVKRFYLEDDQIRLQPANSAMEPMYFPHVDIVGKIVGLVRRMG